MKLRVQHVVGVNEFLVGVKSVEEGYKIMKVLCNYDQFQLDREIRQECFTSSYLQEYDENMKEWCDWYDPVTGVDIWNYMKSK